MTTASPLVPPPPAHADRLDGYADQFADLFPRADQYRRFRAYLRGLLDTGGRKNVGAIAARAAPDPTGERDLAQALQHFISHSPWDAGRVVARYRRLLRPVAGGPGAVWVVGDGVIPKKGQHSVGTQRQFARGIGQKLNCQVTVVAGLAGPAGYHPLAVRLYLPGFWLREHKPAVEKTVPAEFREHVSKSVVALGLLDELLSEGWGPDAVAADDGYATDGAFLDGLRSRGLRLLVADEGKGDVLRQSAEGFEQLKSEVGLEHFEGRTWVGWHHHAALVLTAHGFRVIEPATDGYSEADES